MMSVALGYLVEAAVSGFLSVTFMILLLLQLPTYCRVDTNLKVVRYGYPLCVLTVLLMCIRSIDVSGAFGLLEPTIVALLEDNVTATLMIMYTFWCQAVFGAVYGSLRHTAQTNSCLFSLLLAVTVLTMLIFNVVHIIVLITQHDWINAFAEFTFAVCMSFVGLSFLSGLCQLIQVIDSHLKMFDEDMRRSLMEEQRQEVPHSSSSTSMDPNLSSMSSLRSLSTRLKLISLFSCLITVAAVAMNIYQGISKLELITENPPPPPSLPPLNYHPFPSTTFVAMQYFFIAIFVFHHWVCEPEDEEGDQCSVTSISSLARDRFDQYDSNRSHDQYQPQN